MACHYGHLIICVALSHLIQYERTALYMAYTRRHMEVAATLLKHGAKRSKVSVRKKKSYIFALNDVISLCSHSLISSLTVPLVKHGSCDSS